MHCFVLLANGELLAMGRNDRGQCGGGGLFASKGKGKGEKGREAGRDVLPLPTPVALPAKMQVLLLRCVGHVPVHVHVCVYMCACGVHVQCIPQVSCFPGRSMPSQL